MWILLLECFLISSAFSYCLNGDTEFANERQLNIRDALARQKGNIEEIEENSTADDLVTEKRQNSSAVEDYWAERARIVSREENTMLGGHLVLEKNEIFVNKSLMAAKKREFDEGNLKFFKSYFLCLGYFLAFISIQIFELSFKELSLIIQKILL